MPMEGWNFNRFPRQYKVIKQSWYSVYRGFGRISIVFNEHIHEVFVNIYFL